MIKLSNVKVRPQYRTRVRYRLLVLGYAWQHGPARQARDGSIHPAVLVALFHYAAGKPPARVEVTTPNTGRAALVAAIRALSAEDRRAYAELSRKMLAASTVIDAAPARPAATSSSCQSGAAPSLAARA